MTMTDLLACPPALHNRIRAEHAVVRDITKAALKLGAKIYIADEEGGYERKADWQDLKVAMHATDEQTLFLLFPRGSFGLDSHGTRLYISLVYGNDGPDVVADWSTQIEPLAIVTRIRGDVDRAALAAWFETVWKRAVEAAETWGLESILKEVSEFLTASDPEADIQGV